MKTKKILSFALAAIMMFSMATTSFAANISADGGSQDVTVTYGMSEGFTVTIPTDFTIDETAKATAKVSASNVVIAHGSTLKVAVSGDDYATTGSWELVDEAETDNMLTYTIGTTEGGSNIVNGSTVLSVGAGDAYNDTVEETMYFTVTDTLSKAGTYKDTLTFTVSVEDEDDGLITFSVEGNTYQAEEGMMWYQFISSSYNTNNDFYEITDGISWRANILMVPNDDDYFFTPGTLVQMSDPIYANVEYRIDN